MSAQRLAKQPPACRGCFDHGRFLSVREHVFLTCRPGSRATAARTAREGWDRFRCRGMGPAGHADSAGNGLAYLRSALDALAGTAQPERGRAALTWRVPHATA